MNIARVLQKNNLKKKIFISLVVYAFLRVRCFLFSFKSTAFLDVFSNMAISIQYAPGFIFPSVEGVI